MRRTMLTLVLAGTALPLAAQTSPLPRPMTGGPMMGGMLRRADANGDGVVTRDEATAAADARFDRLDANHDGTVTPDEIRAARDAIRGRDGGPPPPPQAADAPPAQPPRPLGMTMTREQSRTRALEAFDRADANHDGRVDADEIAALRARRRGERGEVPRPPPQN